VSVPTFDSGSLIEGNFSAAAGDFATLTMALGMNTTAANAVILIAVFNTADASSPTPNYTTVDQITGGGLTFNRYAEAALSGAGYSQDTITPPFFFNSTGGMECELWWAPAPGMLTDAVFTITMAADIVAAGVVGIAVYGCANSAAPWDVNGSLPAANAEPTGGAALTFSTSSIYTALVLIVAAMLDPIVNTDPSPESGLAPGSWTTAGSAGSTSPSNGSAPSYGGSITYQLSAPTVTDLNITTPEIQGPLNGIILLAGALVGTGPETPVLNMANVVVTSLTTESPCTVAEYTTPPTFSPALGLRWSDTRGATFGNPVAQPFGTDPLTQPQWNRTGYARDRVFELFWSAAAKTALNGAFVIVDPWKS
jgi:hypothetical protein